MKRAFLGSVLACLFFLSIVLVYSCRKQELSADDGLVSEDLLESAQEWHKTQTEAAFTLIKGNKKKKKILAPLWNAARLEKSPEGKQVLVVPASDYPVGNKELAAFRTFVFTEKGGEVAGGRIIEVFGDPDYIASHRRELSGKRGSQEIKGFNGVILQYDVNYKRIEGSRYVNGKRDNKNQVRIAKRKPGFEKKGGFFDKRGGNNVMTEEWENPQPGCEYYFLVIINLWTGQITWWEYLGKWCEGDLGDNPWGDEGGGGGGEDPPPGCYSCMPGLPGAPIPNSPHLNALMSDTSSLTTAMRNKLETILDQVLAHCIGQAMNSYFTTNNIKFGFSVDPGMSPQATYNPTSDLIKIKDISSIGRDAFGEELFHAYQNKTYTNGTAQYLGAAGSANIEFEAKVLKDVNLMINSIGTGFAVAGQGYFDWLEEISDNFTKYPTSFTTAQTTSYFSFMETFTTTSGYTNLSVDQNLQPQGLFALGGSSNCPH